MAINVVSNAGPLMVFSKLNVLHLFKGLYGRVEFPLSVYRETVSVGIRRGFADAQILNSFFLQNNWKPVKEIEIPVDLQNLNLDRVLIEAYAKKLISEDQLRFYFQQISEREDIWINPGLCVRLLEQIFGSDPS
jgi:hypothetical protein